MRCVVDMLHSTALIAWSAAMYGPPLWYWVCGGLTLLWITFVFVMAFTGRLRELSNGE